MSKLHFLKRSNSDVIQVSKSKLGQIFCYPFHSNISHWWSWSYENSKWISYIKEIFKCTQRNFKDLLEPDYLEMTTEEKLNNLLVLCKIEELKKANEKKRIFKKNQGNLKKNKSISEGKRVCKKMWCKNSSYGFWMICYSRWCYSSLVRAVPIIERSIIRTLHPRLVLPYWSRFSAPSSHFPAGNTIRKQQKNKREKKRGIAF